MSGDDVIVFLGPSLPVEEARRLLPATYLPPARQGDVFRALEGRPRVIAVIDGVFESTPSVWHHELLAALDAGVLVYGASSMGALRAAELAAFGMRGVGRIFEQYRAGKLIDDADVALLHADADHGFRPLTVPMVNVRFAVGEAVRARVLTRAQATVAIRRAAQLFYQERSWPAVLRAVKLPEPVRIGFEAWLRKRAPDLKAEDARACLRAIRALKPSTSKATARRAPHPRPSSLVRRRRLAADALALEALRGRPDAPELIAAGLRRALLADWARLRGFRPTAEELEAERASFVRAQGRTRKEREAALRAAGLDDASLDALLEDVLLERFVLQHAMRMVPDGPSPDEALAAEARLRGIYQRHPLPLGEGPAGREGRGEGRTASPPSKRRRQER